MSARAVAPALNVRWHDGRLVGRVVTKGPTYFVYDEAWLATGHDLSPVMMPFTPEPFRQRVAAFDQLPGFLADCLPDQWGRRMMNRAFNEAQVNATPMRMLAWVGQRGIGALSFEPAIDEDHGQSSWEPVNPLLLTREAQAVLAAEPAAAFEHLRRGGTAGGALPKATVALLADGRLLVGGDVATAMRDHASAKLGLLKLDCEENPAGRPTDGRMEHAYMEMARAAGVRTARTQLMLDAEGERERRHLFVERFDCEPATGKRLHLHTLAGVLHNHDLTYENLLLTTRRVTASHVEVLEAVRRMIFNVRSGNADDHGKNHSFLYQEQGRHWMLSPAYDLTLNFSHGRQYDGLFPASFGPSPRRATLAGTARDAGVSQAEFDLVDAEVAAAVARWPEFASAAGLPAGDRDRAARIHEGLSESLGQEIPVAKKKRRKFW
ncbi:MAG: serine/threonine-protein kinase HipA [Verrucomicrobiota bacterium]|nr:serine/threonine-protein kinase HipA [Verrucomicrobiota bacterium]